MEAIQTWYRGYYFRSRKEARVAVFLDELGVKWEYEMQGYADSEVAYLPDFWLPELDVYLEVKPNGKVPSIEDRRKASHLAAEKYRAVFIHYADIGERQDRQGNDSMECIGPHGIIDSQYWFCQCEHCGLVGIQWQGRTERLPCGCHIEHGEPKVFGFDTPAMDRARLAARSARFEHGEYGGAA